MFKDIIIVGCGRENSTRCPQKLIRKLPDGNTIFNMYMKKLSALKNITRYRVIVAINKKEKTLLDIANGYDIEIIDRNDKSVGNISDLNKIHHYMEDFNNEYMMWINASFPFIKPNTLIDMIDYFNDNECRGMHCIRKVNNWLWEDNKHKPLNVSNIKNVKSQDTDKVYESVHCCHIFDRRFMLDNNMCWRYQKNDPILYEVKDSLEFLDVDTETDFMICRSLYEIL